MNDSEGIDAARLAFDREKWAADERLRERELDLRQSEIQLKREEQRQSRWRNPLTAAENLQFLVDTGLIINETRVEKLADFLANRVKGSGPAAGRQRHPVRAHQGTVPAAEGSARIRPPTFMTRPACPTCCTGRKLGCGATRLTAAKARSSESSRREPRISPIAVIAARVSLM